MNRSTVKVKMKRA